MCNGSYVFDRMHLMRSLIWLLSSSVFLRKQTHVKSIPTSIWWRT